MKTFRFQKEGWNESIHSAGMSLWFWTYAGMAFFFLPFVWFKFRNAYERQWVCSNRLCAMGSAVFWQKKDLLWVLGRALEICLVSPVVCDVVLKPYFVSSLTDIWCALNNMNYVLRNKLLTPLEFLQEHFNPGPATFI